MTGEIKKKLRKDIQEARFQLSAAEVAAKSKQLMERFTGLAAYEDAKVIMAFVPFRNEVDTRYLVEKGMADGKQMLVPLTITKERKMIPSHLLDWDEDLVPGAYGIPEPAADKVRPVEPEQIDLVIVPGVAFDLQGNRLGYGGGYYDRFFEVLQPDCKLVAIGFELQIVPEIPVEEWDQQVDGLVTEDRAVWFSN